MISNNYTRKAWAPYGNPKKNIPTFFSGKGCISADHLLSDLSCCRHHSGICDWSSNQNSSSGVHICTDLLPCRTLYHCGTGHIIFILFQSTKIVFAGQFVPLFRLKNQRFFNQKFVLAPKFPGYWEAWFLLCKKIKRISHKSVMPKPYPYYRHSDRA